MTICYIIAAVLFAVAFFGPPTGKYSLIAAGLFFMAIAPLGGAGFHIG